MPRTAQGLTLKQERFALEYAKDQAGAAAAIRAGYSRHGAERQGHCLLMIPRVRERVDALLADVATQCGLDARWVVSRLMEVAERSLAGDTTRSGGKRIDSIGASKALELLGKVQGMFAEKSTLVLPTVEINIRHSGGGKAEGAK